MQTNLSQLKSLLQKTAQENAQENAVDDNWLKQTGKAVTDAAVAAKDYTVDKGTKVIDYMKENPWQSAGYGLVGLTVADYLKRKLFGKRATANPVLARHRLAAVLQKRARFKSQAQRRKFYAMKDSGEISKKTLDEWEADTPKGAKLPEKVAEAVGGAGYGPDHQYEPGKPPVAQSAPAAEKQQLRITGFQRPTAPAQSVAEPKRDPVVEALRNRMSPLYRDKLKFSR